MGKWLRGIDISIIILLLGAIGLLIFNMTQAYGQGSEYDRGDYGGWVDSDGDCLNTRHEALAAESLVPPLFQDCKVVKGLWFDPYTGLTFTDPRRLDVDHLVPLAEAHRSGAASWSHERKVAYANDLDNPGHLIAVQAGANRSKGAKDPAQWLPSNWRFHCAYAIAWTAVKVKWELSIDPAEALALESLCD